MITSVQGLLIIAAQGQVTERIAALRKARVELGKIFEGSSLDDVRYTALVTKGQTIAVRSNEKMQSIESAIQNVAGRFEDDHPNCHIRDCAVQVWAHLDELSVGLPEALFVNFLPKQAANAA